MASSDEIIKKIISLGLSEQKAKETIKNAALTKNLLLALSSLENQKRKVEDLPKTSGLLIYHLCSKIKAQSMQHLDLLVGMIADNKLDNTIRVDFSLEYVLTHSVKNDSINVAELEQFCGVNVIYTFKAIYQSSNN